jgi:hypothetical protein
MTAPRGNTSNLSFNQALSALAAYIDGVTLGASSLPMSTVLRVDLSGDNLTAQRGRFDLPYRTVQAAVTASWNGDVVLIGAGVFAETVLIPSDRTSLSIIGMGINQTLISGPAGPGLGYVGNVLAPVPCLLNLTVKDITLIGNGGPGLVIDGTLTEAIPGDGSQALSGGSGLLYMDSVRIVELGGGVSLRVLVSGNVSMLDCLIPDGNEVDFHTVSSVKMENCESGQITFRYADADAVKPIDGRANKMLFNCRFDGLVLTGIDDVACDSGCISTDVITVSVVDSVDPLTPGLFEFHGICQANMSLAFNLTAARTPFNCDRCKVVGALTVARVAGGLLNFYGTANFRGAVIQSTGAASVTAGVWANIDLRAGTCVEADLTTLPPWAPLTDPIGADQGCISRDKAIIPFNAYDDAAHVAACIYPPMIDANYSISAEYASAAANVYFIDGAKAKDRFLVDPGPAPLTIRFTVNPDLAGNAP